MRNSTHRPKGSHPWKRRTMALAAVLGLSALGPAFASPAGAETTATVSGVVRISGTNTPIANAHVTLREVGKVAVTNATGAYSISGVPLGNYTVDVDAPCRSGLVTSTGEVTGNKTVNLQSPFKPIVDAFGHVCRVSSFALISDSAALPLTGDDASVPVNLPFGFPFYGSTKTSMKVSSNGYLTFGADDGRSNINQQLLNSATPRDSIFAFWDDLVLDGASSVVTGSAGTAPTRTFMVEWRNVKFFGDTTGARITIQAQLSEDGTIGLAWTGVGPTAQEQGASATIGLRDAGSDVLEQSFNTATLVDLLKVSHPTIPRPVAKAGSDQTVPSGAAFTLDGSKSTGPTGTRFLWTQVGQPTTVIANKDQATATVSGQKGPQTLTYDLTVTDPFARTNTDRVVINVQAAPK